MQRQEDTPESIVRFEHVAAGYGRRVVFSDLDFELRRGDFLGLVGPNGGGKTTLLRLLLGLLEPQAGRIVRFSPAPRYGYVPQRGTLDPAWPLKAREVVAMSLYRDLGILRRPGPEEVSRAEAALQDVGVGALADTPYADLSGGMKQRVLVARALAADPSVLVLDEPAEGMDLPSVTGFAELVKALVRRRGLTVIWASHDLNTVASYVDRVALARRGAVVIGPASELLTDSSLTAAYETPVVVTQVDGRRVVYAATPGGHEGER